LTTTTTTSKTGQPTSCPGVTLWVTLFTRYCPAYAALAITVIVLKS